MVNCHAGGQRLLRCRSSSLSNPKLVDTKNNSANQCTESIYETIPDTNATYSNGPAGSLKHTYAVLEHPLMLTSDQDSSSRVPTDLQLHEVSS